MIAVTLSEDREIAIVKREPKEIQIGLEEVLCHFHKWDEPREPINIRHLLVAIVVIAIMGFLAGASGPTSIAERAGCVKNKNRTGIAFHSFL
jgi:hypothetical protein